MNYIKNYSITFNASSLEFQSTPSVGRATNGSTFEPPLFHDFNPRPPWGGRRFTTLAKTWDLSFQSTPSVGRATIDCDDGAVWLKNFNPRPPWGGRLRTCPLLPCPRATFQSTPSVGRATIALTGSIQTRKYISIHALRGEGDLPKTRTSAPTIPFQSTPSVGRATLSPCKIPCRTSISIHALRGEGDARRSYHGNDNYNFNPRPPWGGRRRTRLLQVLQDQNFNPRPPWGGRPAKTTQDSAKKSFQSTPSVGRATGVYQYPAVLTDISIHALRGEGDLSDPASLNAIIISIHALRGEGDHSRPRFFFRLWYFNPRPPWGGRRWLSECTECEVTISIHALRGEGDDKYNNKVTKKNIISIHALRGEGDAGRAAKHAEIFYFNPRPPWGGRLHTDRKPCTSKNFNPRPPWGGRR